MLESSVIVLQNRCNDPQIEKQFITDGLQQNMKFEIMTLWSIYRDHVDIAQKVIHCPSFSKIILLSQNDNYEMSQGNRAIIASVCVAAVNSLNPYDDQQYFSVKIESLHDYFENSLNGMIGLFRSDQLTSVQILQAIAIYIVSHVDRISSSLRSLCDFP